MELVEKRNEQVSESCEQAIYPSECAYTFAASQQVFSRGELGKWDSSARAWLQCGDQAKMLQHDQLKVILNNLTNLPVNDEPRAYESVIKAWISALKAMDCLIRGIPQRVQYGSTLLAMSSWHLYPDMTILDAKITNDHQKDDLFQKTAILTVGLQLDALPEQSVFWSLPLACLQYYGHPVRATRTLAEDSMRLTMDQFERMVLGCVFGKWKDYAADLGSSLFWLQKLSNAVEEPTHRYLSGRGEHGYTRRWSWLSHLCSAAENMNNLVQLESVESELAKQQEAFGRRYSSFLYPPRQPAIPLFGLSKLSTILLMIKTVEHRLELLRDIAAQNKLDSEHYIIRYRPAGECGRCPFEYATVVRNVPSLKRILTGEAKNISPSSAGHIRWLPISDSELAYCTPNNYQTAGQGERDLYFGWLRCTATHCSDA
jgi:hypothetical protein